MVIVAEGVPQVIRSLWKRRKQGLLTPFMAMFIFFMVPITFMAADYGLRVYLANDLRMTLDNAVLTAVGRVNYDGSGRVWIDEIPAREEVQLIMGDALTDGGKINEDGETEDYNINLLARAPIVSFYLLNPEQGASESGSFDYKYWERNADGTHVWNTASQQFEPSVNGTHTEQVGTHTYTDLTNPTLYIHVDLEYRSPIMQFMTPQTFQRVSGAEVFVGNSRPNYD